MRFRQQPTVRPDDRERPAADREADETSIRRVHDAPTLDRSAGRLQFGLLTPVHESYVSFAPGVVLVLVAEGREASIRVELQVVQKQDALAVESRLVGDRKSTRLNSSHVEISYAVFCLKKKKTNKQ